MLNMTDKSRKFLSENLPQVITEEDIGAALRMLNDMIDRKGFAPPDYYDYSDFGREAQKVYDDLYYSN